MSESPVLKLLAADPHLLPRVFSFAPLAHHARLSPEALQVELIDLENAGLIEIKRFADGEGLVTLARTPVLDTASR